MASYDYAALLYLNTQGEHFEGGDFAFVDAGQMLDSSTVQSVTECNLLHVSLSTKLETGSAGINHNGGSTCSRSICEAALRDVHKAQTAELFFQIRSSL